MSKKLIAAAFAAAFLASGGLAYGGAAEWNTAISGNTAIDGSDTGLVLTNTATGDMTASGSSGTHTVTVTSTATNEANGLEIKGGSSVGLVFKLGSSSSILNNASGAKMDFTGSSGNVELNLNGGTFNNSGTLTLGATTGSNFTFADTRGTLRNTGDLIFEKGGTFNFDGVIDNTAATKGGSASLTIKMGGSSSKKVGNNANSAMAVAQIFKALAGTPDKNVGYVTLALDSSEHKDDLDLTSLGIKSGEVLVTGTQGAGKKLDLGGTILTIDDSSIDVTGAGALAGRDVNITDDNTSGGDIKNEITAWGSQADKTSGLDKNKADGTVTLADKLNLDGNKVYAGKLALLGDTTVKGAGFTYNGAIDFAGSGAQTLTVNSDVVGLDISGYGVTGEGTIDNDGTLIAMGTGKLKDGTTGTLSIGSGVVIDNSGGTVQTDSAGILAMADNVDQSTSFGNFDVIGGIDASTLSGGLDWSDALAGTINLKDGTGKTNSTLAGDIDIGGGTLQVSTTGTNTIAAGANIAAAELKLSESGTNNGTIDSDLVTVDLGKTLTNSATGIIELGGDDPRTLDVQGTALVNNGVINTGDDTIVTAASANKVNNAGGTFNLTGGSAGQTELNALTNALKTDDIGTVNLTDDLTAGNINIAAKDGALNITGVQNNNGNAINVGQADLNVVSSGNKIDGALTGDTVNITGDDSIISGAITGATGVTVAEGATGNTVGNVTATTGDIVFKEAVDSIGDLEAKTGSIELNGGEIDGKVTAAQDLTATDTIINDKVTVGGDLTLTNTSMLGGADVTNDLVVLNTAMQTYTGNYNVGDGKAGGVTADAYVALSTFNGNLLVDNNIYISNDNGIGSLFNGNVLSIEGNIYITGGTAENQPHRFANGITTLDGFSTLTNGVAAMKGVINSDLTVDNGGVLVVGLGGTFNNITVAPGDLAIGAGNTLTIGSAGTLRFSSEGNKGTAYVLSADGTSTFQVNQNATFDAEEALIGTGQLVIDQSAIDVWTFEGATSVASVGEIDAFLARQDEDSFGNQTYYDYRSGTTGNIYLDHYKTDLTDEESRRAAAERAAAQTGLGSDVGMVTDGMFTNIANINNMTTAQLNALAAIDPNAAYIASVLDGVGGKRRWNDLTNSPDEVYASAQYMQGRDLAGALEAVTDTVRSFSRAITNRAYNLGGLAGQVEYDECGNLIASCDAFKTRIWAGYTGQWDKLSRRSVDKGYEYDAHGFNIGVDHLTSSGVAFGAAFGYSKGDFDNRGSLWNDSDIDNYSFGVFASYNHHSGIFTTISGTYTYSDYDMRSRFSNHTMFGRGGIDRADYHGNTWSVGGELGYDFKPMANLTVTPTLGLYYYDSSTKRFDSTYRNGMKYSRNELEMPLEVTLKYDVAVGCDSTLSLIARGGYAYNFTNKGTRIRSFDLSGLEVDGSRFSKPGHSRWNAGAGIQYRYKGIDVGVTYDYVGRKDYTSHNLTANVGYSF